VYVAITTDTSWTGGDPDNDYNNYDVYFGTTNPPVYYDTVYFVQGSPISYIPGTLTIDTTYYWQIVAWDCFGDSVTGPVWSFTTGAHAVYTPPPEVSHYAPTADPNGPYSGVINTAVQFDGTGSHVNFGEEGGTLVEYDWSFFDGDPFHDLGATPTHTYTTAGTYTVTLRVLDSKDGIGIGSTTAIIRGINTPPVTPTITGPTTGDKNTAYNYAVTATDPDNNNIRYVIDWGDGTTKTTSPFGASSVSYTASHTWTASGVYTITVHAEDDNNGVSGTASLQVSIGAPVISPVNGYLIDTNGDGTLDSFHNNATGQNTQTQKQSDGTYLVDINGDGTWDYVYNPALGTYTPYSAPTGPDWFLWGVVIVIVIIIIVLLAWLMRRHGKK
jgi:hypothetical protein